MKTFNNYQKYSDYKKGWGTSADLMEDVIISTKHLIPTDFRLAENEILNVSDQSDEEKGIKFEIKLKSGDVLHAYKISKCRMQWEWFLNKNKCDQDVIKEKLEEKIYQPFERWKYYYDTQDKTYLYSDDYRAYINGLNHQKKVIYLYNSLSTLDKNKADKYIKGITNNETY